MCCGIRTIFGGIAAAFCGTYVKFGGMNAIFGGNDAISGGIDSNDTVVCLIFEHQLCMSVNYLKSFSIYRCLEALMGFIVADNDFSNDTLVGYPRGYD